MVNAILSVFELPYAFCRLKNSSPQSKGNAYAIDWMECESHALQAPHSIQFSIAALAYWTNLNNNHG